MHQKKIVHLLYNDKFIKPFIEFVEEHKIIGEHTYIYFGGEPEDRFPYAKNSNVRILDYESSHLTKISSLMKYFYRADKIILHSLIDAYIIRFLYYQPWLLKKCYWIIWGADLYYHIFARKDKVYYRQEKWRKRVIGNMGYIITNVKGDYELAQKWYGVKGEYLHCIKYPDSLYRDYYIKSRETATINIQIGNSADPSNNHLEVLEKLKEYKDEDIKIFIPLSYGNKEYAKEVIVKANEIFGKKFIPLTEFMPFEKYLEFLSDIDIAVFAHKRQQAMGNIITLLWLGKKVYMRSDITTWKLFEDIDVKVFDINDIKIDKLDSPIKKKNRQNIKANFSSDVYIEQLNNIFR